VQRAADDAETESDLETSSLTDAVHELPVLGGHRVFHDPGLLGKLECPDGAETAVELGVFVMVKGTSRPSSGNKTCLRANSAKIGRRKRSRDPAMS